VLGARSSEIRRAPSTELGTSFALGNGRTRPKHQALERVLGTGALFSTAYGNVGSSIYYALGLVAVLALGMTPVVFLISGLIFACTAATYAEATAMYPEAGGSSSFARHAFNESGRSSRRGGRCSTTSITVAISAFFVPHYLAVFWGALHHGPGDIIGGAVVIVVLGALNIVGVKEAAGLNIFLALADFATQLVLVVVGICLCSRPPRWWTTCTWAPSRRSRTS